MNSHCACGKGSKLSALTAVVEVAFMGVTDAAANEPTGDNGLVLSKSAGLALDNPDKVRKIELTPGGYEADIMAWLGEQDRMVVVPDPAPAFESVLLSLAVAVAEVEVVLIFCAGSMTRPALGRRLLANDTVSSTIESRLSNDVHDCSVDRE